MRQKIRDIIRAVYSLPPASVMMSCSMLVLLCYFVLPLAAGVPIVVAAAALPWIEEQLSKDEP